MTDMKENNRNGETGLEIAIIGMAGRFLDTLLESIGIDRKALFITSPIKCFPPANRPPRSGELRMCIPYLEKQIRIVKPKVIIALGNYALRSLLDDRLPISKVHGIPQKREGIIIFPTFHPAAAMRFPRTRDLIKEDVNRLKGLLMKIDL